MNKGYIKLYRVLQDSWIMENPYFIRIWIEMLYTAKYKPEKKYINGKLIFLNFGDFIFGRPTWQKRLKVPDRQLYNFVKNAINDKKIEVIEKNNRYTIYRIVDYLKYNDHLVSRYCDTANAQQNLLELLSNFGDSEQQMIQQVIQQTHSERTANDTKTNKDKKAKKDKNKNTYSDNFLEFWNLYKKKKSKDGAYKTYKSKIKLFSHEHIIKQTKNYMKECEINKTEMQYVKNASTFLNQCLNDEFNENNISNSSNNIDYYKKDIKACILKMKAQFGDNLWNKREVIDSVCYNIKTNNKYAEFLWKDAEITKIYDELKEEVK